MWTKAITFAKGLLAARANGMLGFDRSSAFCGTQSCGKWQAENCGTEKTEEPIGQIGMALAMRDIRCNEGEQSV